MTDLPRIGRPATNALLAAGITTLEAALALGDDALLALHGFGPKALQILRETSTSTTTTKKPPAKKTTKKKTAQRKAKKKTR